MVGLPPLRQQDYLKMTVASIVMTKDAGAIVSKKLRNQPDRWCLLYPRYNSKTAEYTQAKFQLLPSCWNELFQCLRIMWNHVDPQADLKATPLLMTPQRKPMCSKPRLAIQCRLLLCCMCRYYNWKRNAVAGNINHWSAFPWNSCAPIGLCLPPFQQLSCFNSRAAGYRKTDVHVVAKFNASISNGFGRKHC